MGQRPALINPAFCIDDFWCDRYGIFIRGWLHCHQHPIVSFRIIVGSDSIQVSTFSERPDVAAAFPAAPGAFRSGFEAYVACQPCVPVQFEVVTDHGIRLIPVQLPRAEPPQPPPDSNPEWMFHHLAETVNRQGLTVLEIGARRAHAASQNYRQFFTGGSRYIGLDIHPAPGVDLVGDAHQLSSLVGPGTIDAIFSLMVLEHIAMPWQVAAEINRALKPGGLVYHGVPQCWPVHELPNDFWRISDEGLKILFGPTFGFEVIGATMDMPMRIYPDTRLALFNDIPCHVAYGRAHILSRKVAEIPASPLADHDAMKAQAEKYPLRHFA